MNVLFLSPAAQLGGAERCLLDAIAALRETDPELRLSLIALADGPLADQARLLGAEVQIVVPPIEFSEYGESGSAGSGFAWRRWCSVPSVLRFVGVLGRAMARMEPDVVHSNGMKAHILAGLLTPPRTRLVVHLHDFIGARRTSKQLIPALAKLRTGARFVANSRAVAEDFARLAPSARIQTVHNVVDAEYFSPGPPETARLAELAGHSAPPSSTVSFGLVATYARWKGHRLFIEAAGRLVAAHPGVPVSFYVVGGPIYSTRGSQVSESELRAWAKAALVEQCFGLVPFQADIARVYRALNVVVHASTQPEPFGRTIVEAMACARPVVVSREGGAAELFQHGENALGFEPGDATALASAMGALLAASTRARLGEAARAHVVKHFSRERLGSELLRVYRT